MLDLGSVKENFLWITPWIENSTLSQNNNLSLAFYGFNPLFWLVSFLLISFQSVVNCMFAFVVYYGIIIPQQKHQAVLSTYLLGYGVVIPLLLILPFWLIEWFDLHNNALILCVGGSNPAMLVFRCLEAMHGTLPSYLMEKEKAKTNVINRKIVNEQEPIKEKRDTMTVHGKTAASSSFAQFAMYYASSIQFELDAETGSPVPYDTRRQAMNKLARFGALFVQTTLCSSVLFSFHYQVFPSSPRNRFDSTEAMGFRDLFHWGNLLNNYMMAGLTGLLLEGSSQFIDYDLCAKICQLPYE